MSTHNNGRDVAVGGNAMIGGDAHIQGNAHVHHNLVVDGWLDAKNIRGPNRGIYLTVEDLMRYNPHPREGWFAGVGASSPFAAYVCRMGVWMPTGGTIAINVDMSSYTREIAFLRAEIQRLANIVANIINPSQPTDTATITVTANDSTMGTVAGGGTYAVGSRVTLVASANTGYRFMMWSDGNTDNPRTVEVSGDMTLTAVFEATTPTTRCIVNVNVAERQSGLGSVNIDGDGTTATVERGSSVTINAVPNALHVGAYFVKWSDGSTSASRTITVNANMTFTAEFAEVAEVIGGVVVPDRGSVLVTATRNGESVELDDIRIGDIITLTATQNSGYEFVGWVDGNGDSMTGETGNTITFAYDGTQPLEFYAVFNETVQVEQHTVSVESDDDTMGSAVITYSGEDKASVTVDEGTSVLLKATALEGYAFVCWKKGDEVLDWHFNHDLLVTEDATYTAVFEVKPNPDWLYGVFNIEEGDRIVDDSNLESGLTPAYFEDGHLSDFRMTSGTSFIVLYNPNEVSPESWVVDKGSQFEESGNNFNQGVDWITGTYQHSNGDTYNWFQYNGVSQGTNSMLCEITFAEAVNL